MKDSLLEILVCPQCKNSLALQHPSREGQEIISGTLFCSICQKSYEIRRGVPRMIAGKLSSDKEKTAAAFGYEWKNFTALTDKYEHQFLDWIKPIKRDFFKDKVVLDAGCGKGRHVWLAATFGSRQVVGIDLSDAVDVAFQNTRQFPNVNIVQADIYNLPFAKPFDYAYSIGVLHHLPDPKKGFLSVKESLRPGGTISAWVYGKEGNWWIEHLLNPVRIGITSKLPLFVTQTISFILALPFQLALKLVYRPVNIHLPKLKKLLFYNDYLFSISGFSFEENFSIIFDHLVAPTAFYISEPEFSDWFKTAGLQEVVITRRNNNSWRGAGKALD